MLASAGMIIKDEIHGKIIDEVRITSNDPEQWHCITIQFTDKIALHLRFIPTVTVEPELSDWKTGNDKILKKFRSVRRTS